MWKLLLPEVKEVHLAFWFACACASDFSTRGESEQARNDDRSRGVKSSCFSRFCVWVSQVAETVTRGVKGSDAIGVSSMHAFLCLFHPIGVAYRVINPVGVNLRALVLTGNSLSTRKQPDYLRTWGNLYSWCPNLGFMGISNLKFLVIPSILTFGKTWCNCKAWLVPPFCIQRWLWSYSLLQL